MWNTAGPQLLPEDNITRLAESFSSERKRTNALSYQWCLQNSPMHEKASVLSVSWVWAVGSAKQYARCVAHTE